MLIGDIITILHHRKCLTYSRLAIYQIRDITRSLIIIFHISMTVREAYAALEAASNKVYLYLRWLESQVNAELSL